MAGTVTKRLLRWLPALVLAALLVAPLAGLLASWLAKAGTAPLSGFLGKGALVLMLKSLLISALAAIFATVAGTFCGFVLNKIRLWAGGFYRLALLLPLLAPPYIFAVAWKDGWQWLFGDAAAVYSWVGVAAVHTFVFFPLATLITGSAFASVDAALEEAALLVIPFRRMFRKILLPLVLPSLTASFLLILIFSLSDFSVPAFFGVRTFTTEIFTQFSAFYNYDVAIAQSVVLLLLCLGLMLGEARYLADAPFLAVGVKGSRSKQYDFSKKTLAWLHGGLLALAVFAVVLPVFILFLQSFSGKEIVFGQAWRLLFPTVLQSVKLAGLGALVITAVGLWVGFMQERRRFRLPNLLLMVLFLVPSTVLGIALIHFYNRPATNFIYGTSAILLLGFVGRFGFIVARIIGNGLRQVPISLEEAAIVIGIRPWQRMVKIVLPSLFPALFAGFVLAFVLCLGELGTTLMTYPPGTELLPVKIFTISANAPQALTSSMVLIVFGATLALAGVFFYLGKMVFLKYGNRQ